MNRVLCLSFLVLAVSGCGGRSANAPAARAADCSFYQRAAERMKQPEGLSPNVDPAVAWAWLSREAAQAGCSIGQPPAR